MTYYFWLGREAERIMAYEDDMMFFRREIQDRMAECKPEADGWITLYPNVHEPQT